MVKYLLKSSEGRKFLLYFFAKKVGGIYLTSIFIISFQSIFREDYRNLNFLFYLIVIPSLFILGIIAGIYYTKRLFKRIVIEKKKDLFLQSSFREMRELANELDI